MNRRGTAYLRLVLEEDKNAPAGIHDAAQPLIRRTENLSAPPTMTRQPVASSNVVSIGYDVATHTLSVEFRGGALYHYQNVPPDVHAAFVAAGSKGEFHAAHIRGQYTHTGK